jgi:hypothetical protein
VSAVSAGTLVNRIVDSYGGESRWREAKAVEARISMGGMLLKLRGHPERTLKDMRTETELARPHVRVEPIDDRGNVGILDGHDVRLETPDGTVIAERRDARSRFPYGGHRLLRWDRLDALYFIGYTQWCYNAFPALVWRDDMTWRQLADDVLEARFPPHLPAHCELQRFHVDPETGLLRQMDYTAEVFGRWAKAVHLIDAHGETDGIPFPSRRRIWSRHRDGSARTAPAPLMISLDVHEWHLI